MFSNRLIHGLGGCIICAAATVASAAQEEAEDWLLDMHKAIHVRSYSGDLFYQIGREYMTLHLKLGHNEQGNIQTDIVRTDAPSLEVESRNTRLSYLQDPPAGRMDGLQSNIQTIPGLGDWLENCQDNYTFESAGKARVAGRNTVLIKIEPHTQDRNQMHMWLDEETAIPLRVEIREPTEPHTVLESMAFTNVRIGPIDTDLASVYDETYAEGGTPFDSSLSVHQVELTDLVAGSSKQEAITPEDPCLRTQNNCWRVNYVPEGFGLRSTTSVQTQTGHNSLMMFHSDGVTTFSVFIQSGEGDPSESEVIQRGSTLVVSRSIEVNDEKHYSISTVGDIPEATAVRIAQGIEYLE